MKKTRATKISVFFHIQSLIQIWLNMHEPTMHEVKAIEFSMQNSTMFETKPI